MRFFLYVICIESKREFEERERERNTQTLGYQAFSNIKNRFVIFEFKISFMSSCRVANFRFGSSLYYCNSLYK